jgi:D-erythrulose 1-phosphate 3-epimerase
MVTIALGVNNGFAFKNWPEPAAWARLVSEELGLKEVQFSLDLLEPLIPEPGRSVLCREVREAVEERGLSLRTTFTGLVAYAQNLLTHPSPWVRRHAWSWYEGAVEVTRGLGAEGTGGFLGAMSAADFSAGDRKALRHTSLIESVRELTKLAAARDLTSFLWELMPTPRELPHTPEEAIDLLQEVNEGAAVPVRLCFDLGHICSWDLREPGDPHRWLERLLPFTPMVHLQQTDGRGDRHWPFTPEFMRTGIVRPERVIEIVKSSPLDRVDLIFELGHDFSASDASIIDDHKRSVEAWARWL